MAGSSSAQRFRVLSQNILAGSWISTGGRTAEELQHLEWETRLAQLLQLIEVQHPDVITLQEVEQSAFEEDLRPRALARGFDCVFSTKSGQPIGVAIFWQIAKFEAETAMHADLTDVSQSRWYLEIAFGFSGEQVNRYIKTARRTTLFVVLRLRPQSHDGAQHVLIVGTTHLIGTVLEYPTNLDVQGFQAMRMMEALDSIWSQQEARARDTSSNLHVVLTGDFNAPPHFPLSVISKLESLIQRAAFEEKLREEQLSDKSPYCSSWAEAGQCVSNPGYMLQGCSPTCVSIGIALPEQGRLLCAFWLSKGHCASENKAARMLALCAESCIGRGIPNAGTIVRSPVYELVTEGRLGEDSIALLAMAAKASGTSPSQVLLMQVLTASFESRKLQSANAEALGQEPATCLGETLDYIFFSPGIGQASLKLLGVLTPTQALGHTETIRALGSDHASLVADFAILAVPGP